MSSSPSSSTPSSNLSVIPLSALASQLLNVTLGGRQGRLWVRQLGSGLYLDLWIDQTRVVAGCLCQDRVPIVLDPACALQGELAFADQLGTDDPDFTGLAERYPLFYRNDRPATRASITSTNVKA